ncbi:MAG TPA: hypothetical protein PKV98_17235 [Burkholderiaceae bacterium]|nr:hypothetical protein [Burkholderiaceae bacterium]
MQFTDRDKFLLREAGPIENAQAADPHGEFAAQCRFELECALQDDRASERARSALRDGVAPARGVDRAA